LLIFNRFQKHSTNLEHFFTASITAHLLAYCHSSKCPHLAGT